MKRFILIVLSISLCISSYAGDIDIKTVRGTSLSELGDAFEVLKRFSSVSFAEGAFYIAGKGQAVIFVDGRRLERHLDLALIPASSIEKVEIVSEPRPEYGNNNGVILITLLEASAGEFHLTDVAEITVSPYAGGSNNAEVSGRKKIFTMRAVSQCHIPARKIWKIGLVTLMLKSRTNPGYGLTNAKSVILKTSTKTFR